MKARFPQPLYRFPDIDQRLVRSLIENADETSDIQPPPPGSFSRRTVIQHDLIRSDILCQKNRFALSELEAIQIRGRPFADRVNLQPARRTRHPASDDKGGFRMAELACDRSRNQKPVVQSRKKLDLSDQQQIADRRGVEDSLHRSESLRKVAISSSRSFSE